MTYLEYINTYFSCFFQTYEFVTCSYVAKYLIPLATWQICVKNEGKF